MLAYGWIVDCDKLKLLFDTFNILTRKSFDCFFCSFDNIEFVCYPLESEEGFFIFREQSALLLEKGQIMIDVEESIRQVLLKDTKIDELYDHFKIFLDLPAIHMAELLIN